MAGLRYYYSSVIIVMQYYKNRRVRDGRTVQAQSAFSKNIQTGLCQVFPQKHTTKKPFLYHHRSERHREDHCHDSAYPLICNKILYIQADHFLIGKLSLYEIAEQFYNLGGELICFDEIHKPKNGS